MKNKPERSKSPGTFVRSVLHEAKNKPGRSKIPGTFVRLVLRG